MRKIIAFIDGASRGNPGPAGAGILLLDENGEEIIRMSIPIEHATNNVAEYRALIAALEKAKALKANQIEIFSDSELLVKQMRGEYKIKNPALISIAAKAHTLLRHFSSYRFSHILREKNRIADGLAGNAAAISSEASIKKHGLPLD